MRRSVLLAACALGAAAAAIALEPWRTRDEVEPAPDTASSVVPSSPASPVAPAAAGRRAPSSSATPVARGDAPLRPASTAAPSVPAGPHERSSSRVDPAPAAAGPDRLSIAQADAESRRLASRVKWRGPYGDPDLWRAVDVRDFRGALTHLEEALSRPPSHDWMKALAMAAVIAAKELPPREALDALVDVFARLCAVLPAPTSPPEPGATVWRRSVPSTSDYFEGALNQAVKTYQAPPRGFSHDYSEALVRRIERLYAALEANEREDPAIRTLVEFMRLQGATAYSEDTMRDGQRRVAERLLPRIRTFVEADRGTATERVRPIVEWMRAWYPSAAQVRKEAPPESTPLPPLPPEPPSDDHFTR